MIDRAFLEAVEFVKPAVDRDVAHEVENVVVLLSLFGLDLEKRLPVNDRGNEEICFGILCDFSSCIYYE